MPKIDLKINNHNILKQYTKGYFFMSSVKIYHDSRYKCDCGGIINSTFKMPGHERGQFYNIPACSSCNAISEKLYIDAKIVDLKGNKKRRKIRYSQDGKRITNYHDCIYTLRQIEQQLKDKTFDIRDYAPVEEQEKLIFKNLVSTYLELQEKRQLGESHERKISKRTLRSKKLYSKYILAYFSDFDIRSIKSHHIEEFKIKFPTTNSQLNHTLAELNTILKFAKKMGHIKTIPEIGDIQKTKKRGKIYDDSEALKIINNVTNEQYQRMLRMLYLIPVRPCDLRALKWEMVDFTKREITFNCHFSDNVVEEGRKSQLKHERYGSVTIPMSNDVWFILNEEKNSYKDCFPSDFVFRGSRSPYVGETNFNRAWRKSANELGFFRTTEKKYDLYELKHLAITRLFDLTNSVLICSKASGVSEKTILSRYIKNQKKLDESYFSSKPKLGLVGS